MIKLQINAMTSSGENGSIHHRTKSFHCENHLQTQSSTAVQNAFQARFPGRNPTAPNTILRNVNKYLNAGTSLN